MNHKLELRLHDRAIQYHSGRHPGHRRTSSGYTGGYSSNGAGSGWNSARRSAGSGCAGGNISGTDFSGCALARSDEGFLGGGAALNQRLFLHFRSLSVRFWFVRAPLQEHTACQSSCCVLASATSLFSSTRGFGYGSQQAVTTAKGQKVNHGGLIFDR